MHENDGEEHVGRKFQQEQATSVEEARAVDERGHRGIHRHYLPSHRCSVLCPSLATAGWSTARSPSGPSARMGMAIYAGREGLEEGRV